MPPWKDRLSVRQRWDLVAHLYSLSGNAARVPVAAAPALAMPAVRVHGRVLNASRGTAAAAGLMLTLVTADAQGAQRTLRTAPVMANWQPNCPGRCPTLRMHSLRLCVNHKPGSTSLAMETWRH